jgi:pimeloyl-ACP methyl ester carboxylesterase
MNRALLRSDTPESAGAGDSDAWAALEQIRVPTTIACGELDVPFFVDRCREIAERIPGARHRAMPAVAHLPYLEDPQSAAALVREAVPR